MTELLLIAKRFLAFVVDVLILFSVTLPLQFVLVFSKTKVAPFWEIVIYAFVVCYFGFSEYFFHGYTLGKRLVKIASQPQEGGLTLFQTFLAPTVVVTVPLTMTLFVDAFVLLYNLPELIQAALSIGTVILCTLVWPISVIIGGGRFSLFDVVARTLVDKRGGGAEGKMSMSCPRYWSILGLSALVLTLPLTVLYYSFTKGGFDEIREARVGYVEELGGWPAKVSFLLRFGGETSEYELGKQVKNIGLYLDGPIRHTVQKCSSEKRIFTFLQSPARGLCPDTIPNSRVAPDICIKVYIKTTMKGFLSNDFQSIMTGVVAAMMLNRYGDKDGKFNGEGGDAARKYLLEFLFIREGGTSFASTTLIRTRVAYFEPQAGQIRLISIEPDESLEVFVGFSFGQGHMPL